MEFPYRSEHELAWIIAGCFALLSALITTYQVINHIRYNTAFELRKYVIRIILMVPIYAIESWLGLRFASAALYFNLLRECYEAFVIYSFYQLLVLYLGGERGMVSLLSKKRPIAHVFPCCCLPAWRMHDRFYIPFNHEQLARITWERQQMEIKVQQQQQQAQQQQQQPPSDSSNATSSVDTTSSSKSSSSSSHATTTTTTTTIQQPITTTSTRIDIASDASSSSSSSSDSSHAADAATGNERPQLCAASSSSSSSPSSPCAAPSLSSSSSSSAATAAAASPTILPIRPLRIPTHYMSPYSRPWHSDFLTHTQFGTLQYVIVKPATAATAFILSLLDLYGDSSLDYTSGYPYLAFIANMSQIYAMYCLVLFYMQCKRELIPLHPIGKFICVKAVVFFTFWQGVVIVVLAECGLLTATEHYTQAELVDALQSFIVCIEMLVAALAHHYAFNWRQFHDAARYASMRENENVQPFYKGLVEAFNVADVYTNDFRGVASKSGVRMNRLPRVRLGGGGSRRQRHGGGDSHSSAALTSDELADDAMRSFLAERKRTAAGALAHNDLQQALMSVDTN